MKIAVGRASTTHVDLHHERIVKSALLGMSEQINAKYIPLCEDHDLKKVVGVNLCATVKELPDGEFGLYVVQGIFDSVEEVSQYQIGSVNESKDAYRHYLDESISIPLFGNIAPIQKTPLNLADLLLIHLDSTEVLPDGTVYRIKRFIASVKDLEIHVYPKDHDPAHFHVTSKQRNIDARFSIPSIKHLSNKRGSIGFKDIRRIQDFFRSQPYSLKILLSEYERLQ